MPLRFLISGTGVGVGKTMVGCALAFAFKVRGMRVGVMKPIETGCPERDGIVVAPDAESLGAAASSDLPADLICQFRYRSALTPIAAAGADGLPPPDFNRIERAALEISGRSDAVLIEDCGGLATPIDGQRSFADLARPLALKIILVATNRGDFLERVAFAADYAAGREIPLRGVILKALDREASAAVSRDADLLVRSTGVSCLGTVRFKEPLALNIVERLM